MTTFSFLKKKKKKKKPLNIFAICNGIEMVNTMKGNIIHKTRGKFLKPEL